MQALLLGLAKSIFYLVSTLSLCRSNNSLYSLPYNSCHIIGEFVIESLNDPLMILFFILITCLYDIVLIL